jgi:hypothetical protein
VVVVLQPALATLLEPLDRGEQRAAGGLVELGSVVAARVEE